MTVHPFARIAVIGSTGIALLVMCACASTQFDRALKAHRWSDAATAFDADTSLLHNTSALLQAAMLHSFPNRDTYDPARARTLFEQLLNLSPEESLRQMAVDQLALLNELRREQLASATKEQALQSKIEQLVADTIQLRSRLDAIMVRLQAEQDQSAILRKVASRLESDLQDREAQLRTLHDELNHLKAIDLKSAPRFKPGDTSTRIKKVPA